MLKLPTKQDPVKLAPRETPEGFKIVQLPPTGNHPSNRRRKDYPEGKMKSLKRKNLGIFELKSRNKLG